MAFYCYRCGLAVQKENSWYGLHKKCFMDWFQLSALEKFQNIASHQQSNPPAQNRASNSSFFHGKFRKYSSTLGKDKYILKVEEHDYPELPVTEYLCNQLFTLLNVVVPPYYLIFFEETHTSFVTKNFMGNFPGSSLIHIYHFFADKTPYDCENLLRIIGEKIGRITAQEDFIYLTLADSLIGNHDRHGRNLGLIQTPKGFQLAPFYDNPSYLGTEIHSLLGADHSPTGAISTRTVSNPTMKDYTDEWKRLGFGYVVEKFRKTIDLEKIQARIKNSYLSPKRQDAIFELIVKRNQELWI